MDDELTSSLEILRRQFEEASLRHPNLTSDFAAILDKSDAHRDKLHERLTPKSLSMPAWQGRGLLLGPVFLDDSHELQAVDLGVSGTYSDWRLPAILTQSLYTATDPVSAQEAFAQLEQLSVAAWRIAFQLPDAVWQLLHPPSPARTLVNRVWIGPYRRFYQREKVLAQVEPLITSGLDASNLYIPAKDEFRLEGFTHAEESELWTLLLYNLAWGSDKTSPLHASRSVWSGRSQLTFDHEDDLQYLMTGPFSVHAKDIPVPVEWLSSTLPCNIFLASVLAISRLLSVLKFAKAATAPIPIPGSPPASGHRLSDQARKERERSIQQFIRGKLDGGATLKEITLQGIHKATGISTGYISQHSRSWKALMKQRAEEKSPPPLKEQASPLDALIAEQEADAQSDQHRYGSKKPRKSSQSES